MTVLEEVVQDIRRDQTAVVLLSGGLDSCVALSVALRQRAKVHALSFRYGQRHVRELAAAVRIVDHMKALVPGVDLKHSICDFKIPNHKSALTDLSIDVPVDRKEGTGAPEEIPATYVPARNTVFLSMAAAFAESIEAGWIYTGFNAVDYSGYPDCRPEFVYAMQAALNAGMKKAPKILVPLILKTKLEVVKLGRELQAPMELSWSCYTGGDDPCGRCDSCKIRLAAFAAYAEECDRP